MNDNEFKQALLQKKAEIMAKANGQCQAIDVLLASLDGAVINTTRTQMTMPDANNNANSTDNNAVSDRQKIANVIKTENRFLHVREIAKKLNEDEPDLSVQAWIRKVSPALSVLRSRGTISKIVVGSQNQNTFWGKDSWKDADGRPLPEHMYKEEFVVKTDNIEL